MDQKKKICWVCIGKHETSNAFHVFDILLHAVPQTCLEQLHPHTFLLLGIFWWAGVKTSNEMAAHNVGNVVALYIYWWLPFQLENSEVCHRFHFTPTYFLYSSFLKHHHVSNYFLKNSQWLFSTCTNSEGLWLPRSTINGLSTALRHRPLACFKPNSSCTRN